MYVKKIIIKILPLFIFFYFANKLCQAYRLAVGADVSEKVLNISTGFSAAFANPLPSFHVHDLIAGVVGTAFIMLGTHTEPRRVNTTMDKITGAADMDHFTVHSLRHTFATRLLEADVSARVVQELLGHSDVTLTLNTYSHVLESTAHEHIARIDNLFGFESEPTPVTKPTKKIETKTSEKKGVRQSLNNAKEKAKIYNDIRDFHKEVKRDQPSL